MNDLHEMKAMLGKEVRVTLNKNDETAVATGKLMDFSEDGGIVLLDETGIFHWCWPNLHTELIEQ